ncbi:MAG: hypothetical protein JSV36_18885 [Anaerolineae bacterium]|nr:MAG: hypothetical protein JSV36_18885 [Anaerolineae bacterium]
MVNYGRTSTYEFLGDFVVYRNLAPIDLRLPPLAEVRQQVELAEGVTPRKSQPDYARAMAFLLRQARALDAPGTPIERLIYVGDTRMNDGTAFANLCRAGGWPGLAFIGSERDEPPHIELVRQEEGTLYLANRWAALFDFHRFCQAGGFPLDERAAVVVDLDKTALGARGRNDHVIDQARVEAVRRTVGTLIGEGFDAEAFQRAYDCLNQPEFHPFTADNQDYLAYVCLILGGGLYALKPLAAAVRAGRLATFEKFIAEVNDRATELSVDLGDIHRSVYARVQQGDPTPFKAFRYSEYRTTVGRMGYLADDTLADELLAREIVVTQEVREVALTWRARGALLFGLSDKPDEASVPTGDLAAQGYQPIHRAETHAVGG